MSVAIDQGSGPAVLLVHGQPGSGIDWGPLARVLSSDHRVVAPDRLGWGDDDSPAAGLAANAAQLAAVAESVQLEPPITVVGHSFGGGVALDLALQRPDLVGSLVLIGSIGPRRALNWFDRMLAVPQIGDRVIRAGVSATRRTVALARKTPSTPRVKAVANRVTRLHSIRALLWVEGEVLDGKVRQSFLVEQRALLEETPALEDEASRIAVPTAVVHGTADRIVSPAAARLLAEWIPGAELVWLRGQGHLVPFERPDLVAPVVRRYAALASRA